MYIGHVGAALAAKRLRPSIGLLALLVATYTPDWVDTGLCLVGRYDEKAILSHSIPAIFLFALVWFALYALVARDRTGALVAAGVVVSHMLLDWITGYKPTWPGGPMIGLNLYNHPIADFAAEGLVIVGGTMLYARTLPLRQRPWMNVSIMLGALLVMQLAIDVAHLLMQSL